MYLHIVTLLLKINHYVRTYIYASFFDASVNMLAILFMYRDTSVDHVK